MLLEVYVYITKTPLFKYIENFTTKNWKVLDKNSDIFHISAQNIYCGYSLEPPRQFLSRNKKNNVYLCKPKFYYIKMGFQGVKLYRYVSVMYKNNHNKFIRSLSKVSFVGLYNTVCFVISIRHLFNY